MIGVMNISSAGRIEINVIEISGEGAKQRRARRDLADVWCDEAADHQDEALKEHPDQARLPALDRIAGLERDRQHDHEGDDEHVRHAHARRQRTHVGRGPSFPPAGKRAKRSRTWTGTS